MRTPYTGEGNVFIGTCRKHVNEFWNGFGCNYQIYALITHRVKCVSYGIFHERKVLSVGWVFRGYGRFFDVPIGSWKRTEL